MGLIGTTVLHAANVTTRLTDALVQGIKPETAACKPEGVDCNSPTWVFGHLAIYPDRILEMMGRSDIAQPIPDTWPDLFGFKSECRNDPDNTIYPPLEEVVTRFKARHDALAATLAETDDDALLKENPNENMRDMFPTIGAQANFMLTSHAMMHLGQVSTWRRCMGLPSAM